MPEEEQEPAFEDMEAMLDLLQQPDEEVEKEKQDTTEVPQETKEPEPEVSREPVAVDDIFQDALSDCSGSSSTFSGSTSDCTGSSGSCSSRFIFSSGSGSGCGASSGITSFPNSSYKFFKSSNSSFGSAFKLVEFDKMTTDRTTRVDWSVIVIEWREMIDHGGKRRRILSGSIAE